MTTIVQLTDTHITEAGRLAYGRVDTHAALAQAVAHINALPEQVGPIGAVVVTGDLTDLGTDGEYRDFRALTAGLQAPVYVLPGNHDTREGMRKSFGTGYLPADGSLDYSITVGALRVIALDTTVPGASHGKLEPDQLSWLGDLLTGDTAPTLVFCHHPPFETGIGHMDRQCLRNGADLIACLAPHPNVRLLGCGHVHRAVQTSIKGVPCMIAPSPSHAVQLDTTDDGLSAFRLEPGAVAVHAFAGSGDGGNLCSHVSFIDPHPGPFPFFGDDNELLT